jgi:hypothetical protein
LQGTNLANNYWIFKVKEETGGIYRVPGIEIFRHRVQDGFWGIRERADNGKQEAHLSELKKTDCVLFFLVGAKGCSFLGTCKLNSEFTKLDEVTAREIVHGDFLDQPEGVFIKDIDKWSKPLPLEAFRGKESFVPGGGKIGAFFKGYIKKIKHQEEYDIVIREHELAR